MVYIKIFNYICIIKNMKQNMKKLILLTMLLVASISFSQIKKIEKIELPTPIKTTKVTPLGSFLAGAEIYEDGVRVTFQNIKYETLTVFESFKLSTEDFNSLGVLLTSDAKVDDYYTIKTLDNKTVYLIFRKSFGVVYPAITVNDIIDIQFPYLNKTQIKKLFDIKE